MCRKLDLFWSESVYNQVANRNSTKSMMTSYISKINSVTYAGKSYDDTLANEGTLWSFGCGSQVALTYNKTTNDDGEQVTEGSSVVVSPSDISEEVKAFWGIGYTPMMYLELEQRRSYWMSRLPENVELDIGTEAIIRQICSLELDINRDRAAGRSVDKSISTLNTLLGSTNLRPTQKKQEDTDTALANTPMGVWLYRYENERPLPDVDDDLKDVNRIKKYIFTWMGHLCRMLGIKNTYSKMYEEEIEKYRVERPEYDGEDDEVMMEEIMSEDEDDDEYAEEMDSPDGDDS